jgi:hypothetical protein
VAGIHITDIEAAINWWRDKSPSPDGITACPEVRALATVYGLMVYFHENECDDATMPKKAPPGSPGTPARPTHPALRFVLPARAMPTAKAVAVLSTKSNTGL